MSSAWCTVAAPLSPRQQILSRPRHLLLPRSIHPFAPLAHHLPRSPPHDALHPLLRPHRPLQPLPPRLPHRRSRAVWIQPRVDRLRLPSPCLALLLLPQPLHLVLVGRHPLAVLQRRAAGRPRGEQGRGREARARGPRQGMCRGRALRGGEEGQARGRGKGGQVLGDRVVGEGARRPQEAL